MEGTFVVIGGGIAGVSCVELLAFLQPNEKIILLSESALIKTATNIHAITRTISSFDVEQKSYQSLSDSYPNVTVIHDRLMEIISDTRLKTFDNLIVDFKYLCICTGGTPKLIPQAEHHEFVLGIRDTDSVENLIEKLAHSKVVAVIGNGGIASELVYKIKNAQVHWIIKDQHISATFIDPGAAEFFQSKLKNKTGEQSSTITKRMKYDEEGKFKCGAALGPDWYKHFDIIGADKEVSTENVQVHYGVEVSAINKIVKGEKPVVAITLSNNLNLECDIVVSATGVTPNVNFKTFTPFHRSGDGGILVDEHMKTSISNIYAAGDVCAANWENAKHWFQMKLWTQARQMGCYAAKCMSGSFNGEEVLQDFCFEIFTHSTKLFDYKVILLGLYNGQKLGRDYEILLRTTNNLEYVKFVLQNNKLQGAILIGETDLEETCENLILNQLDLSPYGDDILNPNIDIEDYFD